MTSEARTGDADGAAAVMSRRRRAVGLTGTAVMVGSIVNVKGVTGNDGDLKTNVEAMPREVKRR